MNTQRLSLISSTLLILSSALFADTVIETTPDPTCVNAAGELSEICDFDEHVPQASDVHATQTQDFETDDSIDPPPRPRPWPHPGPLPGPHPRPHPGPFPWPFPGPYPRPFPIPFPFPHPRPYPVPYPPNPYLSSQGYMNGYFFNFSSQWRTAIQNDCNNFANYNGIVWVNELTVNNLRVVQPGYQTIPAYQACEMVAQRAY